MVIAFVLYETFELLATVAYFGYSGVHNFYTWWTSTMLLEDDEGALGEPSSRRNRFEKIFLAKQIETLQRRVAQLEDAHTRLGTFEVDEGELPTTNEETS